MTEPSLTKLQKEVQLLNKKDQKRLLVTLQTLLGESASKNSKPLSSNDNTELLYKVLADYILKRYGQKSMPLAAAKKVIGTDIKLCAEKLDAFAVQYSNKKMNKASRAKFYALYVKLTAKELDAMSLPVTIKAIIQQHERMSAIFDRNFPGYIKSGLFFKVVDNY